jgi:PhnB protein
MLHSAPFLLFDGNCAEAMTFYQKCLGGALILTRLRDTPMKDQYPPEKHDRIIYAQLKSGAISLSATDWMASPTLEPKPGNTFSIYITSPAYDELKAVFDKLAVGGDQDKRTFVELQKMPFLGGYGQFFDKYGFSWVFKEDKKE